MRIPETLAVGCEANTICIIVLKWYLLFLYCADICSEAAWIKLLMLSMNQGSDPKLDSGSCGIQAVMYPE